MIRRFLGPLALLGSQLLPLSAVHAARRAPHHFGPAMFGAPLTDWLHQKGPALHGATDDVAQWELCADGTTARTTVRFAGGRAVSITGQDCPNQPLDTPARRALAVLVMPQDALIQSTFSYYSYPAGTRDVLVYRSRALGHMLPALDFEDCKGAALPPGTFFLDVHSGAANNAWTLGIGICVN